MSGKDLDNISRNNWAALESVEAYLYQREQLAEAVKQRLSGIQPD